jgi:hypothetical protein
LEPPPTGYFGHKRARYAVWTMVPILVVGELSRTIGSVKVALSGGCVLVFSLLWQVLPSGGHDVSSSTDWTGGRMVGATRAYRRADRLRGRRGHNTGG